MRHVDESHFLTTTHEAYKPIDPSEYRQKRTVGEEVTTDMRHVDESHFLTTTHEAYKPIDPSEYRQKRTVGEEVTTDMRHVDESHFLTTTHEAYKPIDPSEYRQKRTVGEEVATDMRHVDESHFLTTTHEAYKPIDPSEYRQKRTVGEEVTTDMRHVDESHFLTTTHEAYKPIDPAAYKRDALREEVVKVSRRGGDDGHFRTTAKDSYCRYDSSCYKSSCRESSFGDESVISKRHSFTASSEADAAVVKKVVKGKSDGGVTSKKVDVSTDMKCVASGESNGGAAAVVAATTECAAAAVGDQPTGNGVRVSKWKKAPNVGYSCPCHVDADMYVSTAHRDFKAHGASKPYMPKAAPTVKQSSISMQGVSSEYRNRFIRPEVQCPPRPIGKPAVQVRHVDPSMYVTTNRATFVNHSGRKV
ncbi:hypothetical protein, unlikely [Trypanosoma brucei gambiense DAL972]|uniref:Microtubule-associated protein n=1 Tax=Trypanosoma brucei gambiense (strain MHOM/CI/86/DAL972) TaxID=679716 RepID=D0A4H2_TRYB9|nr:hypothetical protein, unlikely [Trypanosoma brucei gambiense DAL972]CBH16166.1 hypothetical protein, unlikely [Trypanosoma brucei gambiense DAL972]|eukprot:XP_011778430.1 hypothetical protein, unlikely [Trypanosoma brucei gambiense DAL972]